jgi:preprotein translocase subunit SecE
MVSPQKGPRAVSSVKDWGESGVFFLGFSRQLDQGGLGCGYREGSAIGTIGIDTMAKFNLFKFLQEVRQEVAKVTWPSRRETTITTVMVFVFAAIAGVFFLMADQVIRMAVTLVLGIGS